MWGALAVAWGIAGLFFLRYWTLTRDRFFLLFALAFWALAAHWGALGIVNPGTESRHYLFLVRLVAFVLIIAAIFDRNRRARIQH
jgi:hypothetical protein